MTKFNVYIMNKKLLPSLYLAIDSDLSQEVMISCYFSYFLLAGPYKLIFFVNYFYNNVNGV